MSAKFLKSLSSCTIGIGDLFDAKSRRQLTGLGEKVLSRRSALETSFTKSSDRRLVSTGMPSDDPDKMSFVGIAIDQRVRGCCWAVSLTRT